MLAVKRRELVVNEIHPQEYARLELSNGTDPQNSVGQSQPMKSDPRNMRGQPDWSVKLETLNYFHRQDF